MNCKEALEKLQEIIDKEANDVDARKVKEHLEHCRECLSKYEFEELFRAFVIKKASLETKTSLLREKILKCCNEPEKATGGLFNCGLKTCSILVSAAVAIILCIVTAFMVSGFYRHQAYIVPFEEKHINYIENTDVGKPLVGELLSVRNHLNNDLRLSLTGDPKGFRLIGAGFSQVRDSRFVHIRYKKGADFISLFISDGDVNLPDFEQMFYHSIEYHMHVSDNCLVLYWKCGKNHIIAVSENPGLDMTPLIPVIKIS